MIHPSVRQTYRRTGVSIIQRKNVDRALTFVFVLVCRPKLIFIFIFVSSSTENENSSLLVFYEFHKKKFSRILLFCYINLLVRSHLQYANSLWYFKQDSPAIADKPARRESLPKIDPIRRCLQRCRWQYWPIFIRLAVVASEICETPRNSLKIQTNGAQGHPRSSILVSIESPCTTSY